MPDERRAAKRSSELAVANAVTLGDLEREIPRDHIDLSAAHLLHEDAVLHRAEDLRRVGGPARDHRRGHPADGQIAERFTPRVPAAADPELLGVPPVREIRPQDALLDQHGPLGRGPLIVHRRRPALVRVGAVVDDGDQLARDLFADAAGVHGEALQVEVSFEPVTDRLVDERAAGLAREHDGVRARRRGVRSDVEHRATRAIGRRLLDRFVRQHLEAGGAPQGLEARLEDVAFLRDDVDGEVEPNTCVCAVEAIAVGDEHFLNAFRVGRGDLLDPGIERPSGLVGSAKQAHLPLDCHVARIDRHGRVARELVGLGRGGLVEVAALGDATGRAAGEGDEVVDIGHVRIRVGRSLAAGHADAGTLIDPADRVLDVVVVEDELQGLVPLPEKLGPVAAA